MYLRCHIRTIYEADNVVCAAGRGTSDSELKDEKSIVTVWKQSFLLKPQSYSHLRCRPTKESVTLRESNTRGK